MGQDISNGCIRLPQRQDPDAADTIPMGTPIDVWAWATRSPRPLDRPSVRQSGRPSDRQVEAAAPVAAVEPRISVWPRSRTASGTCAGDPAESRVVWCVRWTSSEAVAGLDQLGGRVVVQEAPTPSPRAGRGRPAPDRADPPASWPPAAPRRSRPTRARRGATSGSPERRSQGQRSRRPDRVYPGPHRRAGAVRPRPGGRRPTGQVGAARCGTSARCRRDRRGRRWAAIAANGRRRPPPALGNHRRPPPNL